MKITGGPKGFVMEASEHELIILNNCINNAIDILRGEQFDVRVGASASQAREVLRIINDALGELSGEKT